jgi:hypothetical protein
VRPGLLPEEHSVCGHHIQRTALGHAFGPFGEGHPAQVNLDDETHEIEVIVLDSNGRYIKCSSLTLFPKE